jgi:DNA ligase D-like protein (predicted 3'-phosphoesterase)
MSRYYLPMNSKPAPGPFSSEEWLFEIKWDGVRAIAYVNEKVSVLSRNGKELTGRFPELEELRELAPRTVLDGEIVAMSGGRPDIQELLPRIVSRGGTAVPPGTIPITYIVFDILEQDGVTLVNLPLTERRRLLLQRVKEGPHVVISEPVESRGEEYYRAAVQKGLEGVMAKRKDSVYEPGVRSSSWLKIRQQKTCDCVIAGYTGGKGGRSSSFGALVLGLYQKLPVHNDNEINTGSSSPNPDNNPGDLIYIGKVGTGFKDRDLAVFRELFKNYETGNQLLTGTDQAGGVTWLSPALVCEVSYQSVTNERKLRIPGFIRLRSDKNPSECTIDQLDTAWVPGTDMRLQGKEASGIPHRNAPLPLKTGMPETEPLKKYREIRDFSVTSEPEGDLLSGSGEDYFVVQEHHAKNLHFDLRLERDGVLKSWAVPKGVPLVPGEKHLAVAVEDHPLDYGHFEGTIPEGEYGAGTVSIWDNGHYETKHWDNDKIEITFHGKRLEGPYVLVRFIRAGKNEWLLFRAGN